MILEDPPPDAYGDGRPRGMPDWLAAARALPEPELIAACRQENPDWPEAERAPWARAKIRLNPEYCDRSIVAAPPLSGTLSAVACPVLLLHGSPERGGMNTARDVAAMREACAGPFTSVAFDQAGHTPRREARDSYVSAVRSWLAAAAHRGPTSHPHSE